MAKLIEGINDLNTCFPRLALEWDYEKNNNLTPNKVTSNSGRRVFWLCNNHHSFQARIADRTYYNTRCPYCSGKSILAGYNDLFTIFPETKNEWDYDNNKNVNPYELSAGSHQKVWWVCKRGHHYNQSIKNHTYNNQGCPYCSNTKVLPGFNDLLSKNPLLVDEWAYDKNDISPTEVSPHSNKKVWWRCKIGHTWQASILNRSHGTRCPICTNELKTSFQEQAVYYYINKNIPAYNQYKIDNFEFDIYIPTINVAIEYDGYFYHNDNDSKIRERKKNNYCLEHNIKLIRIKEIYESKNITNDNSIIYRDMRLGDTHLNCIINILLQYLKNISTITIDYKPDILLDKEEIWSNYIKMAKQNSLEKNFPNIAREWDQEKNKGLKPEMVSYGSKKKVWWLCKKEHSYEMVIANRTLQSQGCPYCSGKKVLPGFNDFKTSFPELVKEWDYEKNIINPDSIVAHSNKKVWWLCKKGHSYIASIDHRSTGRGCPYCAGKKVLTGFNDLLTTHPNLCKDVADDRYDLTTISKGSSLKIHWKCQYCSYQWDAKIVNRACNGNKCPRCHAIIIEEHNDES